LSDTAGEKLITRCTEAEAQPFEAIMCAQSAYDHALEVAIKTHTVATAGINGTAPGALEDGLRQVRAQGRRQLRRAPHRRPPVHRGAR
jgi:hypothetical protein